MLTTAEKYEKLSVVTINAYRKSNEINKKMPFRNVMLLMIKININMGVTNIDQKARFKFRSKHNVNKPWIITRSRNIPYTSSPSTFGTFVKHEKNI